MYFIDVNEEDDIQNLEEEINYEDLHIAPEDDDIMFTSDDENFSHVIIDTEKDSVYNSSDHKDNKYKLNEKNNKSSVPSDRT